MTEGGQDLSGQQRPRGGRRRSSRRARPSLVALIPLALIASSAVVYQASNAAFTATTSNANNTWSAGTVTLTDNDSGTAMFTVADVVPGDTTTQCILVTYGGSVAADVKLYLSAYTPSATAGAPSGLGPFLNLTVEQGTGTSNTGPAGSCTDFSATSTLTGANDTLDSFNTDHGSYADGYALWSPVGAAETRAYRITWTMQDTVGTNSRAQGALDDAQGAGVTATFAWEARNT